MEALEAMLLGAEEFVGPALGWSLLFFSVYVCDYVRKFYPEKNDIPCVLISFVPRPASFLH